MTQLSDTKLLTSLVVLTGLCGGIREARAQGPARSPNIVVIFIDDMGYADIGPFGAQGYATPNLDRMAAEGMKFTDFVVSSAVCSASRVALMTGCYHRRVGIDGALGPQAEIGIDAREMTLARSVQTKRLCHGLLRQVALGPPPEVSAAATRVRRVLRPAVFERHVAAASGICEGAAGCDATRRAGFPPLPLIEGNRVIDPEVTSKEQESLTTWYTEHAVDFINRHANEPFFLYVPHSMVHVPLHVSDKFRGKSSRGLFGDVVMEVDWSVGEILGAIQKNGLDANTLVIFTADNGPWLSYGDHAGSAAPLREGKGTEFEGGIREPTLMRWPGKIPAGSVCDELASTIDVLPTLAAILGAELPAHKIDGKDIRPLMFAQPGARSPHDAFYCYYADGELQAVRDRQWKLQFPHSYRTLAGQPGGTGGIPAQYSTATIGLELFDLKTDPGETTNVADQHPDEVARLQQLAERARDELGDKLTNRQGREVRPAAKIETGDEKLVWTIGDAVDD